MKTVILYTTRYGATERCAKALADLLDGETELFNLARESRKVDLSAYDRVICGGAVYMGKVDPALTQYCIHKEPELVTKQVGLFTCGLSQEEAAQLQFMAAYPEELRKHAAATACLGTEVEPKKLRLFDKLILKMAGKHMQMDKLRQPDGSISTLDPAELQKFVCKLQESTSACPQASAEAEALEQDAPAAEQA